MAIDEADQSDAGDFSEGEASDSASEDERSHGADPISNSAVSVGEYTWEEFMDEYGYGDEISELYPDDAELNATDDQLGLDTDETVGSRVPSGDDWNQVEFDPESYLGHHPDDLADRVLPTAGDDAATLWDIFCEYVDPETTPVVKDTWTWEHYKWEYYYDEDGSRPRDGDGEIVRHDEKEALGFDPDTLEARLAAGNDAALELDDIVEERTVNVQADIEEDEFFSTAAGNTTVSNRYDLEKAVPFEKKTHFREVERYWVNKPYAYVVIFHSEKENEKKYYMIEPYRNEIEIELQEFLSGKLRKAIKYSEDGIKEQSSEDGRRTVIEDETRRLLKRYDLFEATSGETAEGILETLRGLLDDDETEAENAGPSQLEGIEVRPEPAILADDPDTLSEYQVEKLLYLLKRDFIGYERIDGIKHDINVEDISVDGYNSPVFVYHSEYEQIISNIYHGEDELDDFVVKLAQRSGKGISKRLPQVDATLPDGSRAQLTLGEEVSDHGTNYTIRQFKDVPFTPIDLINWNTFSLDEMAFLWLAIENHKSLIFAGGTASGKTTSLNAVSLFIPSSAKIVSIEDTREVELPQRNWIASVTRPSFSDDEQGDVDEFDLLEAALRQRPDYIVMGEIRGEEGRTLFQVMSTGHTTYTTFHADSVDEVLKRFTTDPINVSKTMFTALDLVSIQTQTRVQGRKVRRNKSLTEINHYEAEHDEINVQDVYQWQAETDEYLKMGDSNTLEEIQFDRGWSNEKLEEELFKREIILAYLIKNELNTYAQVAATVQAFINDPDTILTLIANGQLEDSLEDLREMESVLIDVDPEKEELVPRPESTSETYNLSMDILERAEESVFEEFRGEVPSGLASALGEVETESTIDVDSADSEEFEFGGDVDDTVDESAWELGDSSTEFAIEGDDGGDEPAWLSEDTGFDVEASDGATADAPAAAESAASADETATTDAGSETASNTAAETATAGDTSSPGGSTASSSETGDDSATGAETAAADTGAELPARLETESEPSRSTAAGSTAEPADTGADGTMGSSSDGSDGSDDSTVLPHEDAEDGDLGGLFDDMGGTIDEIDGPDSEGAAATGDSTASPRPDTSGFDSMFPEDNLDSIFDPESADETSADDFSEQFESADSASEMTAETDAPSTDTPSDSTTEPTAESASDTESKPSTDDAATPDDANATASSDEPEPPTIDIDDSTADPPDGSADDSEPIAGTEPESGSDNAADDEPAAGTTPASRDRPSAGREPNAGDEPPVEDPSPSDESTAEAPRSQDGADDGDGDSIFGGGSESIFTDDDADDADDDGSLFDGGDSSDESIFKGGDDEESTENNGGIFGAEDSDEDSDS
ncbi:ATPase, T2SS/T4P/T4SS family [Natrinema versiforme]|uniref:Secretion system protein E n=1 Tax=Natrinema versiforme TaxID=88724 RepID=A0A4P8WLL5_9EURY|nr:ATPase, T2SS/T4P/T4SS family [Natrinema versiforme]QCS43083.1 secretion system protein E [Natrinema versiforme]